MHAMGLFEPGRQTGNCVARLDPQLVRTEEHRLQRVASQCRHPAVGLRGREQLAVLAHLGAPESLEHCDRFGSGHRHTETLMDHLDAGLGGDLRPDIAAAHRATPAVAGLLAGDGNEAEVAHRGAVGLGVAIDHHDFQSASGGGQRMRQADNAGADHRKIKTGFHQEVMQKSSASIRSAG